MNYTNASLARQHEKKIECAILAYKKKAGQAAQEPFNKLSKVHGDDTVTLYASNGLVLAKVTRAGVVDDRPPAFF